MHGAPRAAAVVYQPAQPHQRAPDVDFCHMYSAPHRRLQAICSHTAAVPTAYSRKSGSDVATVEGKVRAPVRSLASCCGTYSRTEC